MRHYDVTFVNICK